ncbi:HAD family hydrolase [Streptomyces sp. NPDC007983]|uniref:HAD family hydrolase n=1 Tax=Streptomyces sp. NPDC007983 TaxID=3364800 RepID=UPI0036E7144E
MTARRRRRWVTFDCFGTLVNWRHGIATGIELVAPGKGWELLEVYNRHEPQVRREHPSMHYSDVLAEPLKRTAAEAKVELVEEDTRALSAGIPCWPAFPDTRQALRELRESGWNLAPLTTCDRVVIGETQRRLRVQFDAIVTAEDSGAYKPAHNSPRSRASPPASRRCAHRGTARSRSRKFVRPGQRGAHLGSRSPDRPAGAPLSSSSARAGPAGG